MLKEAVKSVLPSYFADQYMNIRGKVRLGNVPQRKFEDGNLRSISISELANFFSDPKTTAAWKEDHSIINALYRGEEINMGVNPEDRRAIYHLVMSLQPRNVLEIGTHIGASTVYIASALRRLQAGGRLTTVDIIDVNHPERGPWRAVGLGKSPEDNMKDLGLSELVQFHAAPSQAYMKASRDRYDLIFLDGDHDAPAVYEEVSLALPLLEKGGAILLHDFYPGGKALFPRSNPIGGPFNAMARVQDENPAIRVLPLGALPWPTKQGTNITTLALVSKKA